MAFSEGAATPFCDICGNQVAADALFCRNCRRKFQPATPSPLQPAPTVTVKEVVESSIKKSVEPAVSKSENVDQQELEKVEADTIQGTSGKVSVPISIVILGAIVHPVAAVLLLTLYAAGFSSWNLVLYSYVIAVAIGIVGIGIYAARNKLTNRGGEKITNDARTQRPSKLK